MRSYRIISEGRRSETTRWWSPSPCQLKVNWSLSIQFRWTLHLQNRIIWYPIICSCDCWVPVGQCKICWFHPGLSWTAKFNDVPRLVVKVEVIFQILETSEISEIIRTHLQFATQTSCCITKARSPNVDVAYLSALVNRLEDIFEILKYLKYLRYLRCSQCDLQQNYSTSWIGRWITRRGVRSENEVYKFMGHS